MIQYKTPILLITFNRPEHTRKVLERILSQSSKDLYIFQDGPRPGNEQDLLKCQKVRDVITSLTDGTTAHISTFFSEKNLGCGKGPYNAISWFFDNVEQGIILEDDCIPHPDFFEYCKDLLEKYKNDERVCHIGGNNNGYKVKKGFSYTFASGHHQTWGWATWKRTWRYVDYYLQDLSFKEFKQCVRYYYKDIRQQEYWWKIYDMVKKDRMNDSCWDYQYMFSCWRKHSMAIAPCVNLVSNIGDGLDATHTQGMSSILYVPTQSIFPLFYPEEVKLETGNDDYMMRTHIIPYHYGWSGIRNFPFRVNSLIKRAVGHNGPWFKRSNETTN